MTFGSLFAGIGGFDLGLERAGMECKWQVEQNQYCREILRKYWPYVPKYGDIKKTENLPYVDLICGGFPCQPISVAGKQKGSKDERWLWPEFIKTIRNIRPKYVLVENVSGLLVREMGTLLKDLAQSGYDAEWQMLSAAAFGAPHLRERVFIIAYSYQFNDNLCRHDSSKISQLKTTEIFGWEKDEICNSTSKRLQNGVTKKMEGSKKRNSQLQFKRPNWWAVEPDVGRMAYGISRRVDRLKCLGNAVLPQIAEYLGKLIIKYEKELKQ